MTKSFGVLALALLLASCAPPAHLQTEVAEARSPWSCQTSQDAFGEVTAGCRIQGKHVEGTRLNTSFAVFCSPQRGEDSWKRFSATLNGSPARMEKRIEVSVNGAEKQKLEWKTFSSGGSFGFDNDREILPRMQNIVIRGILGARETSTFRFDWDNWQEPIQFLEENGCAW